MGLTQQDLNYISQMIRQAKGHSKSWQEELDCIPGRRASFNLVGTQDFTATAQSTRGQAITMLVSVDGPFVMTHYPWAVWKPTTPTTATNFGRWRPVSTAGLDAQALTSDFIDISYEIQDTGPTRNFQNDSTPGTILSIYNELRPLPMPTKFEPNSTVSFIPIYENISFSTSGTATTAGKLVVVLPGYRIYTTLGNG